MSQHLANRGIYGISAAEFLSCFERFVSAGQALACVLRVDFPKNLKPGGLLKL